MFTKFIDLYIKVSHTWQAFKGNPKGEKGQNTVDTGQVVMWIAIIAGIVWAIARDQIIAFFNRVFGGL